MINTLLPVAELHISPFPSDQACLSSEVTTQQPWAAEDCGRTARTARDPAAPFDPPPRCPLKRQEDEHQKLLHTKLWNEPKVGFLSMDRPRQQLNCMNDKLVTQKGFFFVGFLFNLNLLWTLQTSLFDSSGLHFDMWDKNQKATHIWEKNLSVSKHRLD